MLAWSIDVVGERQPVRVRPAQIEAWVLNIVDIVNGGNRVEDVRVELKASWPDPVSAARRIAGHANASSGESFLWIIGLDEDKGVVSYAPIEMATWRSQVSAEFNGIAPECSELSVPTDKGMLVALLFSTARRPFVVKNPVHGTKGGGAVALEVPWRDGTAVRTARREDLLRILAPLQMLPTIEILEARVQLKSVRAVDPQRLGRASRIRLHPHFDWSASLKLYVTPGGSDRIALAAHRTRLFFELAGVQTGPVSLSFYRYKGQENSDMFIVTEGGAVLGAPGEFGIRAEHASRKHSLPTGSPLRLRVTSVPAGQDRAVEIEMNVPVENEEGDHSRDWRWQA